MSPRWGPGNRDENERDIVKHIESMGVLTELIRDKPFDVLCAWKGVLFLLEVKHPKRRKAHKEQLQKQADFRSLWPQVYQVATIPEAVAACYAAAESVLRRTHPLTGSTEPL